LSPGQRVHDLDADDLRHCRATGAPGR
jgi:hypothetical protein